MHGIDELRAGDESGIEQALGFGLIRLDDGWLAFHGVQQGVAVGVKECFDLVRPGKLHQFGVEMRIDVGGQAAAQHEPGWFGQTVFSRFDEALLFQL